MPATVPTSASSASSFEIDQMDAMPLPVEQPHVEQRQIGIAATAGAQDPGADGQQFDVVEGELALHANTLLKSRS